MVVMIRPNRVNVHVVKGDDTVHQHYGGQLKRHAKDGANEKGPCDQIADDYLRSPPHNQAPSPKASTEEENPFHHNNYSCVVHAGPLSPGHVINGR